MIEIRRATALVTVQDGGWRTGRDIGLPRSGALDPEALELANLLVGNRPGAAGLELALGGMTEVRFESETRFAVTGGDVRCELDGASVDRDTAWRAPGGATLRIGPSSGSRFAYLAIRGGVSVPPIMGARSTYLPTAIGGLDGRRLAAGDRLAAGAELEGPAPPIGFSPEPLPPRTGPLALIPGPQLELFAADAQARAGSELFLVSARSDRMGIRLAGPPLQPLVSARLPSEGTCIGAVQVPDDGQAIVLLADGPTVGGYPKLGAVASVDLGRLVQIPVGGAIRFAWTPVAEAQSALHAWRAAVAARSAEVRRAAG